jgi:hypothetical protein
MNVNPVGGATLTPGEVVLGIIDYTTSLGIKMYTNTTTGLDTKYDLKPSGLKAFLDLVQQGVVAYAFQSIIDVPMLSNNAVSVGQNATAQAQSKNNCFDATNAENMAGASAAATVTINEAQSITPTWNHITMYGSISFMD